MQTTQTAFTFVFGRLAPKPLTVSAETETLAPPFYQTENRPNLRFPSVFQNRNRTSASLFHRPIVNVILLNINTV